MRAKIIDVSQYQGDIDWHQVADAGVVAAAIRCTVGNYYTDSKFLQNWEGAKDAGLHVSAYHVITPEYSAASQIDRFQNAMQDREPDWPLILDVELNRNQDTATIVRVVKACLDLAESWVSRKPVIYTAKWWWNQHMVVNDAFPDWTGDYALWLAQYPYDPTPPPNLPEEINPTAIPGGWGQNDWLIWQWTSRGVLEGISSRVDIDAFNGTEEEFLQWASGAMPPPPVPGATQVRVLVPVLNIRSGPGTQYQDVGNLHAGDILEVLDLGGSDVWVQFEPGHWAAFKVGNSKFMEVVSDRNGDDQ